MAQFDIIAASTKAYKTCWASRSYLVKLATAPFLIKICCLVFATSFAGQGDTAAFLLFMLPALFAEGWMLSHFTRYLVLGQTWPFRPTGNFEADMDVLSVRARGVLSGTIVYVLIGMALGLMTLAAQIYLLPYVSDDALKTPDSIPGYISIGSVFALAFMFWGFRLVWLFIPMSLNASVGPFLYRLRGLGSSVHMIGVWIVCVLPFLLILQVAAALIAAPIGAAFGSAAGYFAITIIAAVVDTAKAFTTTAGITYGMQEVFERKETR